MDVLSKGKWRVHSQQKLWLISRYRASVEFELCVRLKSSLPRAVGVNSPLPKGIIVYEF